MEDEVQLSCFLKSQFELLTTNEHAAKRRGLIEILKCFEKVVDKELRPDIIQKELAFDVVSSLVDAFVVSSESCREIIIIIFKSLLANSLFLSNLDSHLVPFIDKCFDNGVRFEPSEEIRFQLIQLLTDYLNRRSLVDLEPHIETIGHVLHNSFLDCYSEIKKETSVCVQHMKVEILRRLLTTCSSELVESLETLSIHQHYRVRTAFIDCINVMASNADIDFLKDVFPKLAQVSMDQVPQVRFSLSKVIGNWMINLPFRQYVWDRLISLFLPSLSDEVEDVRKLALEVWFKCGYQYEKDVERDITTELLHLDLDPCPYIKPELQAVPLGCRAIVSNNFAKLLPAIYTDLRDWMEPVKLKASQLLYNLIINIREDITPHTLKLIDVLNEGCKIAETDTFNVITDSIKLTGYFVKSDVWCPVILKLVEDDPTPNSLQVLRKLLEGCRYIDESSKTNILQLLIEPNICQMDNVNIKVAILRSIERLLELTNPREENYFHFLYLAAVIHGTTESLQEQINLFIRNISLRLGNASTRYVWSLYGKQVIEELESITPCAMWNESSVEWKVFNSLLKESDLILLIDDTKRIIEVISAPDKDYEMKFYCLKSLGYLFENLECNKTITAPYIHFCINKVIIPNMKWRAGRAAACVRAAATTSLYLLLKYCRNLELDEMLLNNLITHLVNNCEDDDSVTRHMVCNAFSIIIDNYSHEFNGERFLSIISLMLSRMEDVIQDIRITACENVGKSFSQWFTTCSYESDENFRSSFETSAKRLLLYLYDKDVKLRKAVLDVVKGLVKWDVKSVKHYVSEVITTRSTEIDDLMDFLKNSASD
ncbi:HEAT repeat-containing protein 2 [Chamberlinius hualienensis]